MARVVWRRIKWFGGGWRIGGHRCHLRHFESGQLSHSASISSRAGACRPHREQNVGSGTRAPLRERCGVAWWPPRSAQARQHPCPSFLLELALRGAERGAAASGPDARRRKPARDDAYLLYARSEAGAARRRRWSAAGSAAWEEEGVPNWRGAGCTQCSQGASGEVRGGEAPRGLAASDRSAAPAAPAPSSKRAPKACPRPGAARASRTHSRPSVRRSLRRRPSCSRAHPPRASASPSPGRRVRPPTAG